MSSDPNRPPAPRIQVLVKGSKIHAVSPEGKAATMKLRSFTDHVAGQRLADGLVLPDGIKSVRENGSAMVWVHQSDPIPRLLKWIAAASPAPIGPSAVYRNVRIALPYVIVMGVFAPRLRVASRTCLTLAELNCAFFSNKPLESLDDELCYPALLNCSAFRSSDEHPMSYICTQFLDRSFDRERDDNRRYRLGMEGLLSCLFDTGFNDHCESNGMRSWFTESRSIDPRISSIEAWEEATTDDANFACDVPWRRSGWTVRTATEHIFNSFRSRRTIPDTAASLARFVMNHAEEAAARSALIENHQDPF